MIHDDDVRFYDLLDVRWFYVARRYEDPDDADKAFTKMNKHAARLKGKAEIAGYRLLDDFPEKGGVPRIVVVMGHKESRVREAACMLDGETYPIPGDHVRGLVLRRLRFLLAANKLDAPSGVHTFQHGKGMRLDDAGRVTPLEDA